MRNRLTQPSTQRVVCFQRGKRLCGWGVCQIHCLLCIFNISDKKERTWDYDPRPFLSACLNWLLIAIWQLEGPEFNKTRANWNLLMFKRRTEKIAPECFFSEFLFPYDQRFTFNIIIESITRIFYYNFQMYLITK